MKKTNLFKAVALAAVLLAGTLIGCKNGTTEAAGPKGQIFGYVLDTKGEPVKGATVALGGKTTETNAEGAFVLTGIPINDNGTTTTGTAASGANDLALEANNYKVVVTKKGYLSKTSNGIVVRETTEETDAANFLKAVVDAGQKAILQQYATQVASSSTNTANGAMAISPDGTIIVTKDDDDTFKKLADTYAKEFDAYKSIAKAYEATFVTIALTPANAYFEGVIKTTKSAAKDTVTDAASIKAAPKGVKVKLTTAATTVSGTGTNTTGYVFEATTDKDGKFKFENLPVGVALTLKVEGFESDGNYYSFVDGEGGTATYDGLATQEEAGQIGGAIGTTTATGTFTLEENSGAKNKGEILLYAQPAKIIVTETNLLENTEVAPLALDTAITVKFNKAMDYVELVAGTAPTGVTPVPVDVAELGTKAAYAWDEAKTTVTITPKDGYWTATSENVMFKLGGRAQDGATDFIDGEFFVKLDNVIKVKFENTTTVDAAAVAATETEEAKPAVVGKDSFKLTFDRPLDANIAKDFYITDDKNESLTLTWSETAEKLPVVTVEARDGKFGTAGNHKFTLNSLKAKDGSTTYISFDPEYEAAATGVTQGFKVRFGGFFATGISLVTKAEGDRARTIIGYTSDYLKITFNKNVGKLDSTFDVKDGAAATANKSKDIFIKDNAVYASLANFADETGITITGKVYSVDADEYNAGTDADLTRMVANYLIRNAYVIADTNLIAIDPAIKSANDVKLKDIKPGENVTLTFNKEIPATATLEAELYVTNTLNKKETMYAATATHSGKVVTVTPASPFKAKINNTAATYYLSLRIKSADGATLFSTANPSFGRGTFVYGVNVENMISSNATWTTAGTTYENYIKIPVEQLQLLTYEKAATTKQADFGKVSNSSIVLQFNQAVTGYKAYIYDPTQYTAPATFPTKLENIALADLAKTYATAEPTIAGDTITIVPTSSFDSAAKVAVAVFDTEGDIVTLPANWPTATTPAATAATYFEAKTLGTDTLKVTNATAKITGLTVLNTADINNGVAPKFSFNYVINTYSSTLPTFTLYKKVALNTVGGTADWVAVGNIAANTIYTEDWQENYTYDDFRHGNAVAYFVSAATADLLNGPESFVILATVDNEVIKSNEVTVTDGLCADATWAAAATYTYYDLNTTKGTYTITAAGDAAEYDVLLGTVTCSEYLKSITVTSTPANANIVTKRNANGDFTVWLKKGGKIKTGDKLYITGVTDMAGNVAKMDDPANAGQKIAWKSAEVTY